MENPPASLSRKAKDIAVFCGGTGSNRLARGLINSPEQVNLKLIINAYDDGKSTGKLRRDFHILGPSDIAKNIMATLCENQSGFGAVSDFLRLEFSPSEEPEKLFDFVQRVAENTAAGDSELERAFSALPENVRQSFSEYFSQFVQAASTNSDTVYDLRDFRIRNLVFLGALLKNNRNYEATIAELTELLNVRAEVLLNDSRDLHLVGVTSGGELLPSEASIIDDHLEQDIERLFLLEQRLLENDIKQIEASDDKIEELSRRATMLELSSSANAAIRSADLVIFAPTTIDSSLIPTLMSDGCWRALLAARGPCVFVANLARERGTRTLSEQLAELQRLMQVELGNDYLLHDVIDFVVVNGHGCRSLSLDGIERIAVDRDEIERLGLEVIDADAEDVEKPGYHDGDALASTLLSLVDKTTVSERYVQHLRRQLATPVADRLDRATIRSLVKRILGLNELSPEVASVRVVIAANGRGSRLESTCPKPVYPINGRPCIVHLAEKAKLLDPDFLVVTNEENDAAIREALKSVSAGEHTVSKEPRGSGAAVLAIADRIRPTDENLMILWADAPNLRQVTLLESALIHQALGDSAVTMPTTWEHDPYAGVERDRNGQVTGMFQTKVDPDKKRRFGEHDASLFVAKCDALFDALRRWEELVSAHDPTAEIDLLQAINLIPKSGGRLFAAAIADSRECQGFNTIEEARAVEAFAHELTTNVIQIADFATLADSYTGEISDSPDEEVDKSVEREAMKQRFAESIEQPYRAAALDVDGNLLDANAEPPAEILDRVLDIVRAEIPVALITGRRNDSLHRVLLSKLVDRIRVGEEGLLSRIFVYPFNGAMGYRLDAPDRVFYDRPLPAYFATATMRVLREHLLSPADHYDVTDYKISIIPHEKKRQRELVRKMNHILCLAMIPVRAQISGSITEHAAIVLTSTDIHSRAGKSVALEEFSKRVGVEVDQIFKVGDQACEDGVDYELLSGRGCFVTETHDPASETQISVPIVAGRNNVDAVLWLLPQLTFDSSRKNSNESSESSRMTNTRA